MGYKTIELRWVKDGAPNDIKTEIDSNGTWVAYQPNFFSTEAVAIFASRGSGADPVGATVQLGLRLGATGQTNIEDAVLTLPALAAGADAGFPERVIPQGKLCALVSGYVAPFKLAGAQ